MSEFSINNMKHESFCFVSTVQARGDVIVCWVFSWHSVGPLVPPERCLKTTAYLSVVADHVHPFMTTVG